MFKAGPTGKITYYALRIESQMRGSPHLHALIWTDDCPKLNDKNPEAYSDCIDEHVNPTHICQTKIKSLNFMIVS